MKKSYYIKWALAIMVLVVLLIWAPLVKSPTADTNPNEVKIAILDVGQGDAILIEKGTYQILIDGGPDQTVLSRLGEEMPLSDRRIEKVILTHPHADHLTGLRAVLERYEIGEVYYSGLAYDSNGYTELLFQLREKSIPVEIPEIGQSETVFPDGTITFLWPGAAYKDQKIENANNTSEVLRFCFNQSCGLFLGDLEEEGRISLEAAAQKNNFALDSSLLKIAHHGSLNGTDQRLLDLVKPIYAVISVGKDNKFGHPHQPTLDLLGSNNIKNYRTDQSGTVKFHFQESGIVPY